MIRSLWTAATGMSAQQFNIDTISNNLSNINTTGFKKNRPDFEDLLYQTIRTSGTPATNRSVRPVGVEVGVGTRVAGTQKVHTQGSPKQTGRAYDAAIFGEGMFKVQMYDGTIGYTRDGSFKIDNTGTLLNSHGYIINPDNPIVFPEGHLEDSVTIDETGRVYCKVGGSDQIIEVGQLELFRFVNVEGMKAIGGNLLKETAASGPEIAGLPGLDGFGTVQHKFLEMSNVQIADEMVNMIVAQRAYEFNAKAIQTSDNMLSTAVNLKR